MLNDECDMAVVAVEGDVNGRPFRVERTRVRRGLRRGVVCCGVLCCDAVWGAEPGLHVLHGAVQEHFWLDTPCWDERGCMPLRAAAPGTAVHQAPLSNERAGPFEQASKGCLLGAFSAAAAGVCSTARCSTG